MVLNTDSEPGVTAAPTGVSSPFHRPIVFYPGFDVMTQQEHWDIATRELIQRRLYDVPPIRFFTEHEARTLAALVDRVLPQDDRPPEERIPIVPWIDQRCFNHIVDGWRFEDMPPDEEAWRLGLEGINEVAGIRFGSPFVYLDGDQQDAILHTIGDGNPPGAAWERLPPRRFWLYIVLRQITSVYYAHPTSWNEIGFGGPAYPRGYFALSHGYPEPWEVREVRLDET
jgi:hypothetical protein